MLHDIICENMLLLALEKTLDYEVAKSMVMESLKD